MRRPGHVAVALVIFGTVFAAASANAVPARWNLVTGNQQAVIASFANERDCQNEIAHLRALADRVWRLRLGEYYERISANPEPQDDFGRAQLWMAYQRMEHARHKRDLASFAMTCRVQR
jgi:hypothetical protein